MAPQKWSSPTAQSVIGATGVEPVEGVIRLAENLTRDCDLDVPAKSLEMLASFQGAHIEECQMQSDGRLIALDDDNCPYLIQVNSASSVGRKNFSICHEIAHTLMPNFDSHFCPHTDEQTMQWGSSTEEEYLCDIAAAELLMPRREFVPLLRGCEMRIEAIKELAERFGSSLEATAVNIVRAQIEDVAIIVWELGWNKEQAKAATLPRLPFGDDENFQIPKKFRIKFSSACGQMREFFFPKGISIEDDSLIAQAAQTELSVTGIQELRYGSGKQERFFTQSQSFLVRRGDTYERKIFTLVHKDINAIAQRLEYVC